MEPESLATVGRQVGQKFADTNHFHFSGSTREILIDQMQKFRLWADNMGLCSYGHHSLDYRCRDAPKVYEYVHQLLTDLGDTLELIVDEGNFMQRDAETMFHGAEEGIEAMDLVDSDSILGGEQFMDDEAPEELDEPLARLALDNIRDTIDRLYRLSFRIRNPATRLGFSKAKRYRLIAEDGTDISETVIAIDLKHVDDLMAKHLKMPPEESRNHFLVQRLAKANTARRQQFGLWRKHRLKVEQQIESTERSKNIALHKDSGTTSQQTPDTISQPTTATRIDASICLDENQSVFTSSTFTALSREDQGREIVIPRLPEKVRGKDFECPYCYILCPGRISDGSAWKQHVFIDLRPYICTYEYCLEASQQYDSITDWRAHEYYNHKDAMCYPSGSPSDDSPASQQDDTSRPPGLYDTCREQCPVCGEEKPSFSHVAHHLRRIAAFALPRSAILEDDIAPGSQDSNDANLESDEDSTERLSESELEDIEGVSSQSPLPTSLPQDHNQQHHPIPGLHHQLHLGKHPNQPIDTSNLLSSNAIKRLDNSSQTGFSIRDYLSDLDYDRSEKDAGQWSKIISPQASVSKLPASSRPDGYTPSQSPDDRIVESEFQKFQGTMKKPKAKQKEPTLAHSTRVESRNPENLSFYVRIEPLSPDYGYGGQPIRHVDAGDWLPPNRSSGIKNGQGPISLFRWAGGRVITVPPNDQIQATNLDRYLYRAATIFTQYPDTPHLLVVPFDARTRNVFLFGRGWQRIKFIHNRVGNNSNAYYSYISDVGTEPRIAAPGSEHWIPQLLPPWYDCDPRHALRTQAGLIGQLPLLFALAAFSAPAKSLGVLSSSMKPGRWMSHGQITGHEPERGMVVTVYLDPLNPQWSTPQLLDRLQNGEFGPFFGP